VNDGFNATPSPEYSAAKAALEAARQQYSKAVDWLCACDANDPDYKRADAECRRMRVVFQDAQRALDATPDEQYLNEVRKDEHAAFDRVHDDELARRGRQIAAITIDIDFSQYPTIDKALDDTSEGTVMLDPAGHNHPPFLLLADTRKVSAAQLVETLRWLAERISENGLSVHNSRSPLNRRSYTDWWVDEFPDGRLRHEFFRNGDPSDDDLHA